MTIEPVQADGASDDHHQRPARGGYALLVAAGIFLSRIAGLIRERVFAHYFGSSPAAGAFKAALRIPNFLQNMFGEGVLSASFIPVYARLLASGDEKTAGRVAGVIATILALVVAVLVALGLTFSPLIVTLIAPGFKGEIRDLTISLVRILFPGIGLLVLSAWCLGVLNSHRKFFISYVAPVLWNAAMIGAMVIFGAKASNAQLAIYLAWGTVAGCILQLGIQIPFVIGVARGTSFGLETSLAPVREVVRNFVPVFIGRGVVQVSAYVDEMLASLLGASVFAALSFAQTLYLLPVSLFGMSVAAAELAEMSRERANENAAAERVRARMAAGLRQIAFFVVPTTVAFLIIGRYLVSGLYETGEFRTDASFFVWYILAAYSVGLLASTMGRLYSSTYYAMGDTKTPLRYAIVRVTTAAVFGLLLAFPLRGFVVTLIRDVLHFPMPEFAGGAAALGAVGLSLGSAIAAWIEFFLLRRGIVRRIGGVAIGASFFVRLFAAAVVGAAAALAVARYFPALREVRLPLGLGPLVHAGVVAATFGVIYFALTAALAIPESNRVVRRILRR